MHTSTAHLKLKPALLQTAACLALIGAGAPALAGEAYKLRQSPIGQFGGEMAASADNPGFFGTAALTYLRIDRVLDENGNDISVPARAQPLPTATPTGGAVPNGTYTLIVPPGSIDFHQTQTQLNLLGGYVTDSKYGDGRLLFAINLPLIRQSRSFLAAQALGTVSPTPPAGTPAPLLGAINAVAAGTNAAIQSGLAAGAASQNAEVSGIGDVELSMAWIRQMDRLKIAAGASLYLPTGTYDKARGPNPGFGNFYTLRPGVALTYSLNPNHTDSTWDAGVTLAGRISYGVNSSNKDTDYRSGNFLYTEVGVIKVSGNWAYGANLLSLQQVSDDSGTGAPANGNRLKNFSAGPFLSYKLPGKDAGFNLHYSQNFGGRNTLLAKALQLRFIKAW